jgi:hypothetical protein
MSGSIATGAVGNSLGALGTTKTTATPGTIGGSTTLTVFSHRNRGLRAVEKLEVNNTLRICFDLGREIAFDIQKHPHLHHRDAELRT